MPRGAGRGQGSGSAACASGEGGLFRVAMAGDRGLRSCPPRRSRFSPPTSRRGGAASGRRGPPTRIARSATLRPEPTGPASLVPEGARSMVGGASSFGSARPPPGATTSVADPAPPIGEVPFRTLVLCRNVLIYFGPEDRGGCRQLAGIRVAARWSADPGGVRSPDELWRDRLRLARPGDPRRARPAPPDHQGRSGAWPVGPPAPCASR